MSSHIENEGTLLLFLSVEINRVKCIGADIRSDTCVGEDEGIVYGLAVTQSHQIDWTYK